MKVFRRLSVGKQRLRLAGLGIVLALVTTLALQQPSDAELPRPPLTRPLPPVFDRSIVAFSTEVTPSNPCLGQPIVIKGRRYRGATRVVVWMPVPSPAEDPHWERHEIDNLPYAVKLGEALVDANGDWQLTVVLQPKMGPATTGGFVLLEPGGHLNLAMVSDAGRPGQHRGPSVGIVLGAAGSPCPVVSLPPRPSLALEPPHPCLGQEVMLRGANYSGTQVTINFGRIQNRWGHGPRVQREASVNSDGSFTYRFVLDDIRQGVIPIFTGPEAYSVISARDAATNFSARVEVPVCVDELKRALAAPTVSMSDGANGAVDLPKEQAQRRNDSENVIIRSPMDLEAAAVRHGIPSAIFDSLPTVDYEEEVGLLVLDGISSEPRHMQILGVEPGKTGYTVHTVQWVSHFEPIGNHWVFDFVTIPRTELPITFAPIIRAERGHARRLKPEGFDRKPDRLELYPHGPVNIYPGRQHR